MLLQEQIDEQPRRLWFKHVCMRFGEDVGLWDLGFGVCGLYWLVKLYNLCEGMDWTGLQTTKEVKRNE